MISQPFKFSQLRPQTTTSWSRDEPSALCPVWILALQDAWAWPNGHCSMTLSYGAVDDQNTLSSFKHIRISISFSIFHSTLFMFVVYSTLHNFVFYISFHVSFHLLLSHPGTFKSMVHISWSIVISWPCIFYSFSFLPFSLIFTSLYIPLHSFSPITLLTYFFYSTRHQIFISIPLSIPFSHHIPFNFHPVQFPIPYPV